MGRDHELGSLTVGKKADVVLFDFRRAHLTPAFNLPATLVHLAQGRDIAIVIVDGRIVVEDGHATHVDEEKIRREGTAAADRLLDPGHRAPTSHGVVTHLDSDIMAMQTNHLIAGLQKMLTPLLGRAEETQ